MSKRNYDLEERIAGFGENIIVFAKEIPNNVISIPIKSQLIKSATSIGANYCEADDAESRKDFIHKIGICKKEARETKHWLRMLSKATPEFQDRIKTLWQEAHELHLIFNAIIKSTKSG